MATSFLSILHATARPNSNLISVFNKYHVQCLFCVQNHYILFHYNRHEDNKLIVETIPAIDFIKRLIIHIPDKHFKMIRYYDIYNSSVALSPVVQNARLLHAIHPSKHAFLRSLTRWRLSLLASFSSVPLRCPCGCTMEFLFLKHKKTTLDDLLRKLLAYP